MRPRVILLLLMGFCAERAWSLYCYRCDRVTSHADCKDSIKCSDLERYCVSHQQPGPGEEPLISKWCSPVCTRYSLGTQRGHSNVSMDCCQTDYCNSGGPRSGGSSWAVVISAILVSFCILQKGL